MTTRVQKIAGITITDPAWPTYVIPDIGSGGLLEWDPDRLAAGALTSFPDAISGIALAVTGSTPGPTVVAGGPNGHKYLHFDGTQRLAAGSGVPGLGATADVTIAVVFRMSASNASSDPVIVSGGGNAMYRRIVGSSTGLNVGQGGTGVPGLAVSWGLGQPRDGQWHVLVGRFGSTISAKALGGSKVESAAVTARPDQQGIALGGNSSSAAAASSLLTGDVAYLKYFNRGLSDFDTDALIASLKTKYAL